MNPLLTLVLIAFVNLSVQQTGKLETIEKGTVCPAIACAPCDMQCPPQPDCGIPTDCPTNICPTCKQIMCPKPVCKKPSYPKPKCPKRKLKCKQAECPDCAQVQTLSERDEKKVDGAR